jgi:hypothetical protein
MNKAAALERLTRLESEAAELRKIIEQPEEAGLWEPEKGDSFHYIDLDFDDGQASDFYSGGSRDGLLERFIDHGNCFPSASIARKAAQLQRVHNHVMRACFQADPDAGEWSDKRCVLVFKSGKLWHSTMMGIPTGDICVHTNEQAAEACRLLNAWQAKDDEK